MGQLSDWMVGVGWANFEKMEDDQKISIKSRLQNQLFSSQGE